MYSFKARICYTLTVSSMTMIMVNERSWSSSKFSLLSLCNNNENDDKINNKKRDNQSCNVIALYLTKKSKEHLKERLSKVGYKDYTADYVVIKRLAGKTINDDIKYYEQYYGDKAAFRLKGIIKTDDDLVVVIILL